MAARKKLINAEVAKRPANETHVALAVYINETTGVLLEPEQVALVHRLYPLFLKTPAVVKAREEEKKRRAAEAAEREAARTAKARARLAKLDAQRAKLLAQVGEPAEVIPPELVADEQIAAEPATPDDEDGETVTEATVADAPKFPEDEDDWDDEIGPNDEEW